MPEGKTTRLPYRRTYFEENSKQLEAGAQKPPSDPLRTLMMHGMPNYSQVQYRLQVESGPPVALDSHVAGDNPLVQKPVKHYSVRFSVPPESINLKTGQDGVQRANVEVGLIARSESGNALNWMVRDVGLAVRPEQLEQAHHSGITFHLDFDIPEGTVYLNSGLYDSSINSAGTLEILIASILDQTKVASPKAASAPLPAQEPIAARRETSERVTVQQLEQFVSRLHDSPDKEVARQILACKLTERLSTVRLERLQESLPGDQSRSSMLAVADASAFLPLPPGDLAPASNPNTEAQRAMLSRAVDFVVTTT